MMLLELGSEGCEAAFRAWRAGSGPLLPYVRSTPFVSLARYPGDMELPDPAQIVSRDVPELQPGELLILDLPGAVCLRTGLDLAVGRSLWPIVTFSHWHHPQGMVGSAESAALLLLTPPSDTATQGWCLLVDADRYQDDPPTPDRFNNQYELTEDDLPSVEELRHIGVHSVCFMTEGPPKDDLRRYGAYLSAAQITVRWHA